MAGNPAPGTLSRQTTNFIKGISIILIALHNYYRWVNPITGENEFWFTTSNYVKSYVTLLANPLEIFNVFFNFLGFYGVQGFIVISAYGLTVSYREKRPGYFRFVSSRFNKLYPAFFFAAVMLVVFMILQNSRLVSTEILKNVGLQLTLLANFFPGMAMTACGPWWFYSFIFQFYLVFPFIILLTDKWDFKALIGLALFGYLVTILLYPTMNAANINPYHLVIGHLPEFCLGIFLALRKDAKIPVLVIIPAAAVLVAGNLYSFIWPFANLAAALLIWEGARRWDSARIQRSGFARIIAFIGLVSMYIFAIQGFTRWSFVDLANSLANPVTSLILGLCFLAFTTGIAYVMLLTEQGLRGWIASGASRGRRLSRFAVAPLLILASLGVLYAVPGGQSGKKAASVAPGIVSADSTGFEIPEKGKEWRYTESTFFSGKKGLMMPGGSSFSPRLEFFFEGTDPDGLANAHASVMVLRHDTAATAQLVLEVLDKISGERLVWQSAVMDGSRFPLNKWTKCTYEYRIPKEYLFKNYFIRIYLWNNSKGSFFADDMKLVIAGKKS